MDQYYYIINDLICFLRPLSWTLETSTLQLYYNELVDKNMHRVVLRLIDLQLN